MYRDRYEERENKRTEALERYTVLTPADVMDILNIGKNAVYELLNSGQLKGFRIGKSWRISAEELERFMLISGI